MFAPSRKTCCACMSVWLPSHQLTSCSLTSRFCVIQSLCCWFSIACMLNLADFLHGNRLQHVHSMKWQPVTHSQARWHRSWGMQHQQLDSHQQKLEFVCLLPAMWVHASPLTALSVNRVHHLHCVQALFANYSIPPLYIKHACVIAACVQQYERPFLSALSACFGDFVTCTPKVSYSPVDGKVLLTSQVLLAFR